jgi:hypothetical protein
VDQAPPGLLRPYEGLARVGLRDAKALRQLAVDDGAVQELACASLERAGTVVVQAAAASVVLGDERGRKIEWPRGRRSVVAVGAEDGTAEDDVVGLGPFGIEEVG